jgi:hypothetical protein
VVIDINAYIIMSSLPKGIFQAPSPSRKEGPEDIGARTSHLLRPGMS